MEPRTLRLHCVAIKILLFALLLPPSVMLVPEPFAILTPLHYIAYLGEPAVRFNCSAANASNISWHINGSSIDRNFNMGIITETDLNLLESTLTISSTFINNNTRIQCTVHHLDEHNFTMTDEAIFQVQGILEKCSHLQFVFHDAYHLNLTWNPPPTLNITAVEPDISGYVVCDDIRTTCTHIDMRESGGDSHNLPEYIFPNLRVNITFTVRAVNIVGDGESTNVTYSPCLYAHENLPAGSTERFGAQDLSAEMSYDSEGAPTLSLTAMSQRSCFDVYLVRIEPLELDTDSEGSRLNESIKSKPIIPSVNDSGDGKGRLTLNVTTNSSLDTNMFYNATLIAILDGVEAGSIQFSTYDVQDAVIHVGGENISIQCIFACGSYASGCHVKIGNTTIQIIKPRNATQTENKIVTGLTPGSYEVLIFDWEKNGSIATTPSHLDHVHVTEPTEPTIFSKPTTFSKSTTFSEPTSFSTPTNLSRPTNFSTPTSPTSVSTATAPGAPYTSIGQTQPTSLPVEYIAAIGGGVLVILVLLVLVVVMFIIVCKRRRREPMPKELEKDLAKGLKGNIYELSPTRAIVRLDSKTPPLDGSPTDPHYDIIPSVPVPPTSPMFSAVDGSPTDPHYDIIPSFPVPPTSPMFSAVDGSPTDPLYDVIPSLPIPPTSPTSSMAKGGSGLSQSPAGVTQTRHTSCHTYTQLTDTSSHIYTPVKKKKFQDISSHIYAKPVKEKRSVRKPVKEKSVRKPVAASSTDRTATDGDSDRGTTPPDHHSSEGSDLTPPLPPRNYNNSEFDIPPLQLCASTSPDKLASTKPTRQCSSCTILPGPSTGSTTDVQSCTLPQSTGHSYFSLQHLPGISVFPVSSNQYRYSQKQDQEVPCKEEHS